MVADIGSAQIRDARPTIKRAIDARNTARYNQNQAIKGHFARINAANLKKSVRNRYIRSHKEVFAESFGYYSELRRFSDGVNVVTGNLAQVKNGKATIVFGLSFCSVKVNELIPSDKTYCKEWLKFDKLSHKKRELWAIKNSWTLIRLPSNKQKHQMLTNALNGLCEKHDKAIPLSPEQLAKNRAKLKPNIAQNGTESPVTSKRDKWVGNMGGVSFEALNGNLWVEKHQGKTKFIFKEIQATNEFIEITDQKRGYSIKLYRTKSQLKPKKGNYGHFLNGEWK
jgi:hypothetical protein